MDVTVEKKRVTYMGRKDRKAEALVESLTKVYGACMIPVDRINVRIPKGE